GYGLIRFHKSTRKIRVECWPRHVDVTKPVAAQFPGWPVTIDQEDNYGRAPVAYLPTLIVEGIDNPVVQVVEESSAEIVSTLRINGMRWRGKVYHEGTYTIHVGEGRARKSLRGVASGGETDPRTIRVTF
ncbi:MAG: hypothetical protein ACC645_12740, partial [Pirellulales bacterium]